MAMIMKNLETGQAVKIESLEDACGVLGIDPSEGASDCIYDVMAHVYGLERVYFGCWEFSRV